jgi:UDP-2,3-diacylglucosamine pyrophosphatase LpxH
MTLLEQVKNSLKWKQSNYYCATKLGISIEKYKDLKRQLKLYNIPDAPPVTNKVTEFKENLDNGTAEIKGFAVREPRTAEDIIELLKIDTTKWKLSSYWNKERHDGWFISAMVTAIKHEAKDHLADTIANFKPEYQPVGEVFINEKFDRDNIAILSVQDLHFGKENNEYIFHDFTEAVKNLVQRAFMSHKLTKIVYVVGGDLLNMDTFSGTTTSGTPLDNHQRAQFAYTEAFNALYWSINYLKQFCENLHVVYVPGNHDRLSSFHMAHALSKCFDNDDYSIYFDVDYSERKVVAYGNNFFAFEHGDVTKKNTPLVYATEFPILWGRTKYRTCYTGHFHSKKTVEYITENEHNGFAIKHLPSLSSTDYWHYHNKFVGSKRQAIMEIHDAEKGKVSEFIYTA